MANICFVCNKGTIFGRNISHKASGGWARKAHKTQKKSSPNLRALQVESSVGNVETIKVCMKCYKKIRAV